MCGAPVVAAPNGYPGVYLGGSMMATRTHQELIAACAEHGWLPYNNETLAFDSHAELLAKRDDNTYVGLRVPTLTV